MDFPLFRRYADNRSFFRIESPQHLLEVKVIGAYYQVFSLTASQLPDRNYVSDLIGLSFPGVEEITAEEFSLKVDEIKNSKTVLE